MIPSFFALFRNKAGFQIGIGIWLAMTVACSPSPTSEDDQSSDSSPPKTGEPFSFFQTELDQAAKTKISQKLTKWLEHYQLSVDEFVFLEHQEGKVDPFMSYGDASTILDTTDFFPGDKKNPWWSAIYPVSPNQNYVLDIHGYTDISKNERGELQIESMEPDSKVDLWVLKEYAAFRIRFCGTACFFEESAFWDDEVMILAGIEEDFSSDSFETYPVFELIHIKTGESWKFRSPRKTKANGFEYLTKKIQPFLSS